MNAKLTIVQVDCQTPSCDAVWFFADRAAGEVTYRKPSNGLRASKRVAAQEEQVTAFTSDEYLWLFECPFCGYAESDTIEPEDD